MALFWVLASKGFPWWLCWGRLMWLPFVVGYRESGGYMSLVDLACRVPEFVDNLGCIRGGG